MKQKERAYSIALASAFIIFSIFVSSAASPIGNDPHNFTVPEISSGAGDPSDDQILFDEVSSEETVTATESIQVAAPKIIEKRITTSKSEQHAPVIYGNKIVWEDNRNGNWDIYMYDLSTNKETKITTNSSDQNSPDIYSNRVVWIDTRERDIDYSIYMLDLSTKKQTEIANGYLDSPAIYNNLIV